MYETRKPNIPHCFNLAGMKPGDWFMGCEICWAQAKTNGACQRQCDCGGRMLIYEIGYHNVAEVAHHDRMAKSPLASALPNG